jgi:RNA:NAD 2'-phosphotransferase (TPT1/KptA family)
MVHLTDDRPYAEQVARAKSSERALLLEVQAQKALVVGQRFLQASKTIWLTDCVSFQFLKRVTPSNCSQRGGAVGKLGPRRVAALDMSSAP